MSVACHLCPWPSKSHSALKSFSLSIKLSKWYLLCICEHQCREWASSSEMWLLEVFSPQSASAAAKSLQSCPTPRDPMDCSLPGSSVHGILQARVLEWGAIAFSINILWVHKDMYSLLLKVLYITKACAYWFHCLGLLCLGYFFLTSFQEDYAKSLKLKQLIHQFLPTIVSLYFEVIL